MVMSFTRVTPEDLETAGRDPKWAHQLLDRLHAEARPDEPDGYLDKAWAGIQFLLDAAEVRVDLMEGGCVIDSYVYGCLSGWDVGEVEVAARYLRGMPFDEWRAASTRCR